MEEKELVFKGENNEALTTSLLVAERFGKEHKNVLRDIENLSCSEEFRRLNFEHTPYVHPQNGQTYKMYVMTKDGFTFLVMGYTGETAGKFKEEFINSFNKMEKYIRGLPESIPNFNNPAESARAWADEYEKRVLAEKKEIESKNRIDKLIHDSKTYTTSEIAKELGMSSARKLNDILTSKKIQYKLNGTFLLYSNYSDSDLVSIKQTTLDNGKIIYDRRWTNKGREFVIQLING